MTNNNKSFGEIDISPATIATIVSQATNQCYGVVGMAHKNLVNGIATLLSSDRRRGIEVFYKDNQIEINIYVIVQYGVRIKAVAESIQHTVKFQLEKTLGLPVYAINVYVQGLRLSEEEAGD